MNVDDLSKASEVLGWLAARFADMPENRKEAAQAGFVCTMAAFVVSEYMYHQMLGDEPYEALREAAATLKIMIAQQSKG
jgi:hypothetical protein